MTATKLLPPLLALTLALSHPSISSAGRISLPALDSLNSFQNGMAAFGASEEAVKSDAERGAAPSVPDVTGKPIVIAGADNQAVQAYLGELGHAPSPAEERTIQEAAAIMGQTETGKAIADSLIKTDYPNDVWGVLRQARVQITTRDLNRHIPIIDEIAEPWIGSQELKALTPAPRVVGGRAIVCLDVNLLSTARASYVAPILAHELSHVGDNAHIGEVRPGTHLISEQKATVLEVLMNYELLMKGIIEPNEIEFKQFLVAVYRWKNGGPLPKRNFLLYTPDRVYTADEILRAVKRGDDGLKAVMHLTRFMYPRWADEMPAKDDTRAMAQYAAHESELAALETRFRQRYPNNPPPLPQPAPQPHPQPNPHPQPPPLPPPPPPPTDDDDSGHHGGGGGGGGGGINPHPPHPSPNPWK